MKYLFSYYPASRDWFLVMLDTRKNFVYTNALDNRISQMIHSLGGLAVAW
jgi:hypothetical protein